MPIYEYSCPTCDTIIEKYMRGTDAAMVGCPRCDTPAVRIISRPVVRTELTPYYDEGLGRVIRTRQERARVMKDQHAVEIGTTQMSGAKGTIFSHPGRATERVEKSGAHLGPITSAKALRGR